MRGAPRAPRRRTHRTPTRHPAPPFPLVRRGRGGGIPAPNPAVPHHAPANPLAPPPPCGEGKGWGARATPDLLPTVHPPTLSRPLPLVGRGRGGGAAPRPTGGTGKALPFPARCDHGPARSLQPELQRPAPARAGGRWPVAFGATGGMAEPESRGRGDGLGQWLFNFSFKANRKLPLFEITNLHYHYQAFLGVETRWRRAAAKEARMTSIFAQGSPTLFKSNFVHQFFVAPADQNYFLARFCRLNALNSEFWWQSLQAIEKVLKAGLVLNSVSVKSGFRHNIEKLWECHLDTFGDLAVSDVIKPDELDPKLWRPTSLRDFLRRVNRMGHPDSRYGLLSNVYRPGDFFRLDQIYFELRRRTIGLEWIVGADWDAPDLKEFQGERYSRVIRDSPTHQIRRMKFPTGPANGAGDKIEDILFAWNFSFRRNASDIQKPAPPSISSVYPSATNSYLYLLVEAVQSAREAGQVEPALRDRVTWLLDNIQIGADAEKVFRELLSR